MAIYHCSIKIISRGKGKSAVAAAAYRSGEFITNEYDGVTHDYTRKGGIVHTEILLPIYAPHEYADRGVLWNAVEKIEKAKNSQLAREIELALPIELAREQNIELVSEYCKNYFVSAGMCADICIHDKNDGNPHAHIMLTMRPIEPDGSWGVKQKKEYILDVNGEKIYDKKKRQYKCKTVQTTDWNEQSKAEEWRAGWAELVNRFLESENISARIDHRSYERQCIEQVPSIHMGVAARQMEQRGIITERGEINRKVNNINLELQQLKARIRKLKNWTDEEIKATVPNLQNIISEILNKDERKTQGRRIADIKTASKILLFLQTNDITELSQLREKVTGMRGRFNDVSTRLKAVERRIKVLDEHIKQAELYKQHKEIYRQYQEIDLEGCDSFYQNFAREIILFETAKRYLNKHLNGHSLPFKAWKLEAEKLTFEKKNLYREYYQMKDEVREMEIIRRATERIMQTDLPERDGQSRKSIYTKDR